MNKLALSLTALCLIVFVNFIYEKLSGPTRFVVTADTKIIPGSELSKYVTQEEIDDFAFRYWDIDFASNPKSVLKESDIDTNLKKLFKSKQTDQILKFMQDNNISVEYKLIYGTTPIMYSSFFDDENTTKEFIKLGANIRQKDNFGLSPLAYAIENNSTKTAKLLLDSGVKFDEVKAVQWYFDTPFYSQDNNITLEQDGTYTIRYKYRYGAINRDHSKEPIAPFTYIVVNSLTEMAQMVLETGYRPEFYKKPYLDIFSLEDTDDTDFIRSVYVDLIRMPNYKPMFELLQRYGIKGYPRETALKRAYDDCLRSYFFNIENKWEYMQHMNDYVKGEGLLRGYGSVLNARVAKEHEAQRQGKKLEPYKIVQIPLDPLIMNIYNERIKILGEFCGDEDLVIEDIKEPKEIYELQKSMKDNNATLKDMKSFVDYANLREKNYWIGRAKNTQRFKVNDGDKLVSFDEYVKSLEKRYDMR